MNRYGARAQEHWQKYLPTRYSQIEDPETFFRQLGDEIEVRVDELTQALAGDDPPNETFMGKLGRLNMVRLAAEEDVLKELALFPAENDLDEP